LSRRSKRAQRRIILALNPAHREILECALRGTERIPLFEALMKIPAVGADDDFQQHDDAQFYDVFN